jgi:phage gpG-like protein
MAGVSIDTSQLDRVIARFMAAGSVPSDDLMEAIGAIGESQTRRRIAEEKTGPDGEAWPPNREGTSILLRTGDNLLASVAYVAGAGVAEWGAAWQHAHVHQFGAVIKPKQADRLVFTIGGKKVGAKKVTIPPRPFVGVSEANAQEIDEVLLDWVGRVFAP